MSCIWNNNGNKCVSDRHPPTRGMYGDMRCYKLECRLVRKIFWDQFMWVNRSSTLPIDIFHRPLTLTIQAVTTSKAIQFPNSVRDLPRPDQSDLPYQLYPTTTMRLLSIYFLFIASISALPGWVPDSEPCDYCIPGTAAWFFCRSTCGGRLSDGESGTYTL